MVSYRPVLLRIFSLLLLTFLLQPNQQVMAKQANEVTMTAGGTNQIFLPVAANNQRAASDPSQQVYIDSDAGFSFEYPIQFEQSPMREAGCGLTTQSITDGGMFFSQSGDRVLTIGSGIHLTIRETHDLTLAAYVEQLAQRLSEFTFAGVDAQRFNREPRGYVIYSAVANHNTPFALFADSDHLYIFFARLSLACSDEQIDLQMDKVFWHTTESFRIGFGH